MEAMKPQHSYEELLKHLHKLASVPQYSNFYSGTEPWQVVQQMQNELASYRLLATQAAGMMSHFGNDGLPKRNPTWRGSP